MNEQTWDREDLDDMDDEMTVDLGGPCWIDGTDVDPQSGLCAKGHDDLDRSEDDAVARAEIAVEAGR
jgi:hypothetical protein